MATAFKTRVDLLSSVPFDPEYRHTLTFATEQAQEQYFDERLVTSSNSFSNLSYQRYLYGSVKLEAPINKLSTVNYLRFINQNYTGQGNLHENKWFYAFILNIEYVSDTVIKVDYKIDVIQTWMFNYQLNPCYVEREHSNTDNLGDNLIAENLDTGDYITQAVENIDKWDSSYVSGDIGYIQNSGFVVAATQGPDGSQRAIVTAGMPNVMYLSICNDATELLNLINSYITTQGGTGNLDPIVSVNMFPKWDNMSGSRGQAFYTKHTLSLDWSVGVGPFQAPYSVGGTTKSYTPKNYKLYTYPYNYMIFESPDGSCVDLKFENFEDIGTHIEFEEFMTVYPFVETAMAPISYEMSRGYSTIGMQMSPKYMLTCKSYPTCGVASDAFAAWWAQNKYSMPIADTLVQTANYPAFQEATSNNSMSLFDRANLLHQSGNFARSTLRNVTGDWDSGSAIIGAGELVKFLSHMMSGNAVGAIEPYETIGKQMASIKGHQAMPATVACKANSGITHGIELDCYKIYYTRIRPEYAEIIDNYFSCFGYATHKVKVPNVTGRPNWNYVKTVGCTINGNLPSEAEREITQIYDKGITFWHNPNTIHNYNAYNDVPRP